jgi:hypothetical protein
MAVTAIAANFITLSFGVAAVKTEPSQRGCGGSKKKSKEPCDKSNETILL